MKKILIAFIVVTFILSGTALMADISPSLKKKCCIAGVYQGWNRDIASKTCPEPNRGKFTMYIYQEKGCGSKIWGKTIDPSNPSEPMTLKGTVTVGLGGCCIIKGTVSKLGEWSKFEGKICKILGKWVVKKGTFVSSGGCKGTFGMKWVRANLLLTPHIIKKKE